MTRQDEIKEILKALLGRASKAIDSNQYSEDIGKITKSGAELVVISGEVKKYLTELEQIQTVNHGNN